CGTVNPSGGSFWTNPLPNGTFVRGYSSYHPGLDLAAPTGTPIYAANSGPVVYAGWNNWGYGNLVVLAHGPFMTVYGHMQNILVRCGETVVAGQQIGTVGSTGQSTGPHLHFEIRYMGETQNPSGTPGIGW
ncbi:MAG: M23 family metallopeptidase, partial [Chloroflexi bacterium]